MAIAVLAAALRFIFLDDRNLWLDEAASWWTSGMDVPSAIRAAREDIHPPLYYLLLKGWRALFGDSLTAMRGLSAVFGVAVVLLGTVIARRMLSATGGFIVAIWLAVSPHLVFHAQEARMYAVLTTVVLAALIAYLRWTDSMYARRLPLGALAVLTALAIYLHYFAALFVAALWAHFVWLTATHRAQPARRRQTRAWRDWLFAHAAAALLYLPWAGVAWAHVTMGQPWRPTVTIAQLPFELYMTLHHMMQGYSYPPTFAMWTNAVGVQVATVAGLLLLLRLAIRGGAASVAGLVSVALLVPLTFGTVGLLAGGHMHLSRYLAYLSPLLVVGAAAGWLRTWPRAGYVPVIAIILCTLPWLAAHYRLQSRDSDVRPVVRYLQTAPAATVLIAPNFMRICFEYYMRESGTPAWRAVAIGDDLGARLLDLRETTSPAYAIVDYRWPDGFAIARQAGFVEVPITAPTNGVKLFRHGSDSPVGAARERP